MTDQKCMEELSISYLNAVAASANIAVERETHDEDGVDGKIKKDFLYENKRFKSSINYQLKATSQPIREQNGILHYPLKMKNYNDLRASSTVPQLLFLFIMPRKKEEWVEQDTEALKLKKCMYWCNLADEPEIPNQETVTISVPMNQIVRAEELERLLRSVAERGEI